MDPAMLAGIEAEAFITAAEWPYRTSSIRFTPV